MDFTTFSLRNAEMSDRISEIAFVWLRHYCLRVAKVVNNPTGPERSRIAGAPALKPQRGLARLAAFCAESFWLSDLVLLDLRLSLSGEAAILVRLNRKAVGFPHRKRQSRARNSADVLTQRYRGTVLTQRYRVLRHAPLAFSVQMCTYACRKAKVCRASGRNRPDFAHEK